MKIFLIIGTLLVGSALAQKSAAPTKQPKPTKPPKAGPVITCSNITRYEPRTCCPSYPSISGKELTKCGRQCGPQNSSVVCCVATCTLNEVKGINADKSFNQTAIAAFFVKYSSPKNKTEYASFVAKVVQNCIAAPASDFGCPAADVSFCIYRELFFQCPDLKNSTLCKSVYETAKSCPGYPFVGKIEKPKSEKKDDAKKADPKKESAKKTDEKKPADKKSNDKGTEKKNNKNQEASLPKGKNKTTANPSAGNKTSAQPKKNQKAKGMQFPQTTVDSGKSTTHMSESKHGALGPKGPGFKP